MLYFDTLKTSSLESASNTVYAEGGRGNTRLVSWSGEKTVTFTMEDALISSTGLMILAGAGMVEASADETQKVHQVERTNKVTVTSTGTYGEEDYEVTAVEIELAEAPYDDLKGNYVFVYPLKNGEMDTEPYIPATIEDNKITLKPTDDLFRFFDDCVVQVDYYVERASGVQQIEITPDTFGGNYYLEASTLFRDKNGVDVPAEFIIPNCRVQNTINFSMAATGDPSELMRLAA